MAAINKKVATNPIYTHEGARAVQISPKLQLQRSVMACLLWEDSFYESGVSIAERIKNLVPQVHVEDVFDMAIKAREDMKLRHAPLWLARELARLSKANGNTVNKKYTPVVADLLARIIQRADELAEFMSIYWKDGKEPLSAQVKKGLARAFTKFDAYELSKYNRDNEIKLKDVMFLTHPKPANKTQEELWKRLVDGTLEAPDTWEVNLSAGKDKKETFTRLMSENKLGAMALLRNLRNMIESRVDRNIIKEAISRMKVDRVLPYRFITAAKYAPDFEPELEQAMFKCLATQEKLSGRTVLLVDVSGSMDSRVSDKSESSRIDVAAGLAILLREISDTAVYTFSNSCVKVPARRGFALRDAIERSQPHGSTMTGNALRYINANEEYDRIILITDEQSHDALVAPTGKGYCINVAPYKNGVGYGSWVHIDGWSEAVIKYITEFEKLNNGE